mgnify:CR=1 FL=1
MKRLAIFFALSLLALSMRGTDDEVRQTMRRATQYMMDVASYKGGFVWNYLPDYSRQWGELEARRSMVWLQSPGTPDVGEVLLDAYHATGDEYYYDSAKRVARCIIQGQLPCGGWNYMFDMASEDSLRTWYATIGRQAWRLEEFQHYYGNATFDDEATKHCAEFLLRIFLEKHDMAFEEALRKAIRFMLDSQYANGGWPQRYPLMYDHPFKGKADYSSFVTLNDNVMPENIDFLLQCYTSLGMEELKEPILSAMHLMRDLQQKSPLAGWADQYTPDDLQPAHARSYEPRSINTGTTVSMIYKMIDYYRLTGDKSFIEGIPDAIRFLQSQQLPSAWAAKVRRTPLQGDEILMPRFIRPEDGKPMYVHRRGSNVQNGEYYTDSIHEGTIAHYSSFMVASPSMLWDAYNRAKMLLQKDLQRNSPLNAAGTKEPREIYYQAPDNRQRRMPPATVDEIVASLDTEGRWLSPLSQVSHPYKAIGEGSHAEGASSQEYAQTMVGDEYDTSPYANREVMGVSTRTYIYYMSILIYSILPKQPLTLSGLDAKRFESVVEGKKTQLYTLRNNGMEACVTNYGARLVSWMVPDRQGNLEDVVLGFDNIDDYHQLKNNFGSIVGRYIGRIKDARFELDGTTFTLQSSNGGNISHGGYPGFADKVWDMVAATDSTLRLRYVSPDNENGFPGTLTVFVTYHLTHSHALRVEYEATTDKPTVLNLSNHTFFNISGNAAATVLPQRLFIDSKRIATYDKDKNVDGQFMKVKGTPFDFTDMKAIGQDIAASHGQLTITKGYDHAFAMRHAGSMKKPAVQLYDEQSGRMLSVYTDQPAVQVYTANSLNGSLVGKQGIPYQKHSAICLETMHFADSPNHPSFPSTTLRPGDTFHSWTTFQFTYR